MSKIKEIMIVTGLSGAGKTTALKALQDLNFYTVDNLPLSLLPIFIDLMEKSEIPYDRIAIGMDVREKPFLNEINKILKELALRKIEYRILYLTAKINVIINRFKEARRLHPLGINDIKKAVQLERKFLAPLREKANIIIDTSKFNVHQLSEKIASILDREKKSRVTIISFGFAKGIPENSDLVFNARMLPNPHFEEELKDLSGLDRKVKDFLASKEEVSNFIEMTLSYIKFFLATKETILWNPVIAIGCTGGKHRSVYVAEVVGELLRNEGYETEIIHRDLEEA